MSDLVTRRTILKATVAGTALVAAGALAAPSRFLRAMGAWNQRIDRLIFAPDRMAPEPSLAEVTPDEDFPSYFISSTMPFPPSNWMLKVGGLVAHPTTFSLEELQRMPRTDMRLRHHCVEGWSAVASWHGVRMLELANVVSADRRARYVEFRSFDNGYWSSWDAESAFHNQTILAYGMNGDPLYPDHGAPLRLYSPVKLGYKMVKYLTEVNFLPDPTGGYWENQGYEWFAGL